MGRLFPRNRAPSVIQPAVKEAPRGFLGKLNARPAQMRRAGVGCSFWIYSPATAFWAATRP